MLRNNNWGYLGRNLASLKRCLSTHNDLSKEPQLNQFQDPHRPPEQFGSSNPGPVNKNTRGINNPNMGNSGVVPPVPSPKHGAFGIGRTVVGIASLLMVLGGGTGLYRSYKAQSISDGGIEILQEALNHENKGNIDGAIEEYENFLKQLDNEGVEHTNSNYLGAAVRIAELYEIEKRPDKALKIYKCLSLYMTKVITETDSEYLFGGGSEYNAAMTRSLALAVKYASMLPEDSNEEAKKVLLTNIVEAQKQVMEEYPPFITVLNENTNQNILAMIARDMEKKMSGKTEEQKKKQMHEAMKEPLELPIYTTDPMEENRLLGLFVKGWPPFTRSLINARDLYANICIQDGDYAEAASSLTTNAVIIQRCFDHPARLSICLTKLAIVLQMMAETLTDRLLQEKEQLQKEQQEQLEQQDQQGHPDSTDPPARIPQLELDGAKLDPNKLLTSALQMQNPQIKEFVIQKTYKESERIFKRTILLTDKMKQQHMKNQVSELFKPALDKSEMVSACGLALIGYQSGEYKDALKYLQRARVLASRLNANEYLEDINKWIDQVERET
ncbi:hypothetical protein FOA43_002027 [Brettanomyces nanus]|uniref:Uncharacterized protein n=1 Tax=Eeniella nana TaxID=13502 RepID=A0A875S673_EENNA|nr:uncharacterized protein FOA43_002027 [Brettanomyces nanus]QPG74694.1 hypothetical protein FOA43_002027 [Brettanomyces nanus]